MDDKPRCPVKRTFNRDLICLECDQPVYAKLLCKRHYKSASTRKHAERRKMDRVQRKEANMERIRRNLEVNGTVCLISNCNALTLDDTGLCRVHKLKSEAWQFTPAELIAIYMEPCCQICGATEWMVLDHTHGLDCESEHRGRNGCPSCFRGMLCSGCNSALGFMDDVPDRLREAAAYLELNSQRFLS